MALTLQQAKVGMANHVDQMVVDEFRRNSLIFDKLVFDDAVAPGTGGSTLVYGYQKLLTPAKAGGRAINSEYTPSEAVRELETTNLVVMGGSFSIDRVIAKTSGRINEVEFQLKEKVKGTINEFCNNFINGDYDTDPKKFTGLKKLVEGTDSEIDGKALDISGVMTESKAEALCEALDLAILEMIRKPDVIITSKFGKAKLKAAARLLGYYTRSEDAFGNAVDNYDGTPIVELGSYYNGSVAEEIVPNKLNKTDIYLVCLGLDGVHGVTPSGSKIIETTTPDFKEAKAVHKGDVEIVSAIALKNTKACIHIKDIVTGV